MSVGTLCTCKRHVTTSRLIWMNNTVTHTPQQLPSINIIQAFRQKIIVLLLRDSTMQQYTAQLARGPDSTPIMQSGPAQPAGKTALPCRPSTFPGHDPGLFEAEHLSPPLQQGRRFTTCPTCNFVGATLGLAASMSSTVTPIQLSAILSKVSPGWMVTVSHSARHTNRLSQVSAVCGVQDPVSGNSCMPCW